MGVYKGMLVLNKAGNKVGNKAWPVAGALVFFSVPGWAEQAGEPERLEEVTIVGTRDQAREMPGSAYVIDQEDLEIFQYSDINRILAEAPGVYLIEEDGFGLRPNIGIRGSGTERSGKITLMEDGVLISPAPYSNPEAYYFPSAGRMSGIEVLKGPALLREGPYTVGGAVNLLSTPIPVEYGGNATLEVGERGENRLLANYGGSGDIYGWLVETYQHNGDGFKDIDRSNVNAGFRVQDYMAKFRLNTPSDWHGRYQSLDFKLQYSSEESNASYLGLTDVDFDDDPNRRYGMTEKDQMNNNHAGIGINYFIELTGNLDLNVLAYYNRFERDWFKVDKIGGDSLSSVIAEGNAGIADAIGKLHGSVDTEVDIKHNNREYISRGAQAAFDWNIAAGSVDHRIQAGLRLHRDEMDRFQPVDIYNQENGSLVFQSVKEPTGSNNREEEGRALAVWFLDTMSFGEKTDLTLALRREQIKTERTQYADPDRTSLDKPSSQRSNETTEWLPGLGITYQFTDSWQLLAGAHRGMAPAGAGATEDTDPEISTNYELGFRFDRGSLNGDFIGFYSDYQNAIVNCSLAHPCANGETSGTEQLGEAEIKGLEATLGYTPTSGAVSWPLRFSYTYTDAQISEDSADGNVLAGDSYQYIPKNLFFARAGVVIPQGWDLYLSARFVDEMCIDFTCNRDGVDTTYKKTDKLWVFDVVSHYQINDRARVYLKVDNLFDEQKIVSRSPAGARPNGPRTAHIGLNLTY